MASSHFRDGNITSGEDSCPRQSPKRDWGILLDSSVKTLALGNSIFVSYTRTPQEIVNNHNSKPQYFKEKPENFKDSLLLVLIVIIGFLSNHNGLLSIENKII
jgi:hypothetical protein